jgi:hypothetical protein
MSEIGERGVGVGSGTPRDGTTVVHEKADSVDASRPTRGRDRSLLPAP